MNESPARISRIAYRADEHSMLGFFHNRESMARELIHLSVNDGQLASLKLVTVGVHQALTLTPIKPPADHLDNAGFFKALNQLNKIVARIVYAGYRQG